MLSCRLCIEEGGDGTQQQQQVHFPSLDQLEAHLAADHFGVLPYECEQCQFAKFPTEFAVMKHNEQDHGNRSYSFRCRITPEVKAKRRRVREFLLSMSVANGGANGSAARQPSFSQRGPSVALISQAPSSKMFVASIKKELLDHDEGEGQKQSDGLMQNSQLNEENDAQNFVNNLAEAELNVRSEHNENECHSPATLTEQIQAACLKNMRKSESAMKTADGDGGRLHPAIGGTLEIREGAELTAASLLAATKGDVDSAAEGEDATEQMDEQQADVQEILKAAAAAVSQVGGSSQQGTYARRSATNNGGYSLRPNRFSPYALLHQGLPPQAPPSTTAPQQYNFAAKSTATGDIKRDKIVDRIQCRKCQEMVNAQGGCLNHHTNTRHLRLPMFQCTLCNKDFFEVSNTRIHKHMRLHHAGDTSHLVSNYHKYSAALHAGRDDCFGRKEERMHAMRGATGQIVAPNISHQTKTNRSAEPKFTADPCDTVRAIFNSQASSAKCTEQTDDKKFCLMERKGAQQGNVQQNPQQILKESIKREGRESVGEEEEEEETEEIEGNNEMGGSMDEEMPENEEVDVDGENDQQGEEDEEPFEAETTVGMFGGGGTGTGESSNSGQEEGSPMMFVEGAEEVIGGEVEVADYHAAEQQNVGKQQKNGHNRNGTRCGSSAASSSSAANGVARIMYQQQYPSSVYQQHPPYFASTPTQHRDQFYYNQQQSGFTGTEEKIPCKVCGEMVWNKITNRLNHVNVRHLQLPLHECGLCHKSFTSYSRSACYSHVQFAHKTEIESGQCSSVIEEHIIYRKERYNGQLLEAASEYF